jgi:8-amino-7-oxononanoate synthase
MTSAPIDERPDRYRNTAGMIARSPPFFDAAYETGVMGAFATASAGRGLTWYPDLGTSGREVVDFVRTSYLGLDRHPKVVEGAIEAIKSYGTIHWALGRTRMNYQLMGQLEERLSRLVGAHVVTSSTVSMANQGALPLIASGCFTDGVRPVVVFDKHCHATVAHHKAVLADQTEVVTIPHNDLAALEEVCQRADRVAYVADGVYSMGDYAPIPALRELQAKYDLLAYIDDAHGISIIGPHGEGFARSSYPGDLGPRTIIVSSLGKGFGASGGMLMLGTREQEEMYRRYSHTYTFSGAPNLAAIGGALASAKIHETSEILERQAALATRVSAFDERVTTGLSGGASAIRMLEIGDELETIRVARLFLDQGFFTMAAFFPAVPQGRAAIRICITAAHSLQDIERLCEVINKALSPDQILGNTA